MYRILKEIVGIDEKDFKMLDKTNFFCQFIKPAVTQGKVSHQFSCFLSPTVRIIWLKNTRFINKQRILSLIKRKKTHTHTHTPSHREL